MALRWWPVALLGLLALAVVIAVARLLPLPPAARALRPLAHVTRLTELPAYRRVAQLRYWSLVATAVLLGLLFASATVTSARPVGFSSATRNFEAVYPEDIMLCVGQPVTDSSTSGLLNYFANRAKKFTNQRIGLTSPTLRVVPLTRDYEFVTDTFSRYADLAGLRTRLDTEKGLPVEEFTELNRGINGFSRQVEYVDYAQSMEDVLALCMAGFPYFDQGSNRRRSLIYMGYTNIRDSQDRRPSLFSTQDVINLAVKTGIQVNGIARTDVSIDPATNDALASIADSTGGRFAVYNPAGTAGESAVDPTLAGLLAKVADNPPAARLPDGQVVVQRRWDYPNAPLGAALFLAALLSVSLAVLRR